MRTLLILLFGCMLAVMACTEGKGTDAKGAANADSAALRVAVTPTLDCLPLFVAEASGLLQSDGLDVSLLVYTAHMDCDTAVARRAVDGTFTDLVRAERLRRQGVPLKYATSTNLSWQLLSARSARIRQLRQLDDKMVAMTRYSATALLADRAVDSAKLKSERVFRIQVNDVCLRLSMLETNTIDALLLPEPQATQARNARAHVMFDTRQMNLRLGALAFRDDAMNDSLRHQQIRRLLTVYDQACDSINDHGLSYYRDLIVSRCSIKSTTADSLPQNIRFDHAKAPRQSDIDVALDWLKKQ